MTITNALQDLGCNALSETDQEFLDDNGYLILPNLIEPEWLQQLREMFEALCEAEGPAAGVEVQQEAGARRLSDLVNKGVVFDRVYTDPKVLQAVYHVIGRDFKLSSLNARDADPGQGLQQLHADWAPRTDDRFHVCNSVWLLDDFTPENGSTRIVPGSHLGPHPSEVLDDPMAEYPDEIKLVEPAGTVVVFNAHLWHGGTVNNTRDQKRRALHCYFTGREHGQQLNQRVYLRMETWKRISRAARYILDVDVDLPLDKLS